MKQEETLILEYGHAVTVLPSSVSAAADRASVRDFRVLLALPEAAGRTLGDAVAFLSERLSMKESDVKASVAFWRGAGVLSLGESGGVVPGLSTVSTVPTASSSPARARVSDLPQYTTEELNAVLAKNGDLAPLIDACQNVLGKIFNTSEIKILAGLVDYLGLDHDYVLLLATYCKKHEKTSLRYMERMAVGCVDDGITDASSLQIALQKREEAGEIEERVRALLGIEKRVLTKKEKAYIADWSQKYGFSLPMIEKAFEMAADAIKDPTFPYMNRILERFYAEGLKTPEEVEAAQSAYKEGKEGKHSFDIDEVFEAALKRTYAGNGET